MNISTNMLRMQAVLVITRVHCINTYCLQLKSLRLALWLGSLTASIHHNSVDLISSPDIRLGLTATTHHKNEPRWGVGSCEEAVGVVN